MRSIFVHVGLEKTGSTAFQEALFDSTVSDSKLVLSYGNKTNKNLTQALLVFFGSKSLWSRTPEENNIGLVSLLIKDLEKYSDKDLVLSSEHFSGRFSHIEIKQLMNILSRFHKVIVMLVDRDGTEWINSKYNQAVKAGYSKSLLDYSAGAKSDWFSRNDKSKIIADWCSAGVEVKKFQYSASVVSEMLAFMGLKVKVIHRSNVSLSPWAINILRKFNVLFRPGSAIKMRRFIIKVLALLS